MVVAAAISASPYFVYDIASRGTPIDPGNLEAQNAKATLAAIRDKWSTTLTKLTGQQLRSFQDWNKWYNKNKSKPKAWKQTKP